MVLGLVRPTAYSTKQEYVYSVLKLSIVNRQLKPGQRLLLKQICSELSVSASPVREALLRLEAEGLVRIVPHLGATVQLYSPHGVGVHFRIRAALDGLINSIAATRITDEQVRDLEDANSRMDAAVRDGALRLWNDLNLDFHERILRICGEPQITTLFYQLREQGFRFRYFPSVIGSWASTATAEHWEMIDHLRRRDTDLAGRAARFHTEHAGQAVEEVLQDSTVGERLGAGG